MRAKVVGLQAVAVLAFASHGGGMEALELDRGALSDSAAVALRAAMTGG